MAGALIPGARPPARPRAWCVFAAWRRMSIFRLSASPTGRAVVLRTEP